MRLRVWFDKSHDDLPKELKWETIKYLNLKIALKYCSVLKLPREIAYINNMLEIEIIGIWQWMNSIQVKTDSNPKYFEALLQNSNRKHYFGQEETFKWAAGLRLDNFYKLIHHVFITFQLFYLVKIHD